MLTQTILRDRIHYDPVTGIFTWKATTIYQERLVGQVAGWTDTYGHRVIEIDGVRYKGGRLAFMYMLGRWPAPRRITKIETRRTTGGKTCVMRPA